MIYDISGTADLSQIKIYNNELINHIVINRGLARLFDNDVAISEHLSAYTNAEVGALDTRLIAVENEITDISGLNAISAEVDSINLIIADAPTWNSTATVVSNNYLNWNAAYSTVSSNSASWGGASSTLSGLTDTNITSPTNGQGLVWNTATGKWINQTLAGGGVSEATVSGIVDDYDTVNKWSTTAGDWTTWGQRTIDASTYVESNSASMVMYGKQNALTVNSYWINADEGTDSAGFLGQSFYNQLATARYVLDNSSIFETTVGVHNIKQIGTIYVQQSVDLSYDLNGENLVYDGNAGGGTPASLYLNIIYKGARESAFNMPEGETNHLSRLNNCTFGFDDINTSNSYTLFDGFIVSNCTFSGDVGQKFYFKNCYVDLDNITMTTASEFYLDNSCTVKSTSVTINNLDIYNKGIPTYTGSAPSGSTFNSIQGPYIFNDTII